MANTYQAVLADLKAGKYAPLYFLHGDEPFYIDQISDYIEAHALTEAEKGFNLTLVYGKDSSVSQVLEAASRFPMMAQRQVVIVKEAQTLEDFGLERSQKRLEAYAKNPVPSTILVFCWKIKKLDKRKQIFKALDKHAIVVETKRIYDDKLPAWIMSYCKDEQIAIKPVAANMLAEHLGNDLSRIANELKKLLVNQEGKAEVTEDQVRTHIGISKEFNVYELQHAFATKNAFKIHQIINYFESDPKNYPIPLLVGSLYQFFSRLVLACMNNARTIDAVKRAVPGSNYPQQKDLSEAAGRFSTAKAVELVHALAIVDLQGKGVDSRGSIGDILRDFSFKVLH